MVPETSKIAAEIALGFAFGFVFFSAMIFVYSGPQVLMDTYLSIFGL